MNKVDFLDMLVMSLEDCDTGIEIYADERWQLVIRVTGDSGGCFFHTMGCKFILSDIEDVRACSI